MNAKRGYVPEDDRNFSPASVEAMRKASRHIMYRTEKCYNSPEYIKT